MNNKHSVMIHSHRTSLTLEPEFWQALNQIAQKENRSVAAIITELDDNRTTNLSSAVRVYILQYLQKVNNQS